MIISYKHVVGLLTVSLILSITMTAQTANANTVVQSGATYIDNQIIYTNTTSHSENNGQTTKDSLTELLFNQLNALIVTVVGIGVGAIVTWLKKHGIPVSSEQEKMFKDIVTKHVQTLARNSWDAMRNNPTLVEKYWGELSAGHIPKEFQDNLRSEALSFAMDLKKNREFQGFAKNITEKGMEKLLKNVRTNLKSNYQIRMLDVLPKLASIAVESAFDESVKTPKDWAEKSFTKMKPLLISAGALDTEENLKTLLTAEINKKIREGWLK